MLGSPPDDGRGKQKLIFESVDILSPLLVRRVAYYKDSEARDKKDR